MKVECAENGYRRRAPLEESRDRKVESHRNFYSNANAGERERGGGPEFGLVE